MLRDRLARRRAIVFSLLVAFCLVLVSVSRTPPVESLREGVNFAVAPIQETLAEGARSVRALASAVGEIDRLRRENAAFAGRLEELEQQIAQLEAVRADNERLSELLETRSTLGRETVVAQVVARQASQFERGVTLDRGTDAGIEVGDAVLSEGGALAGTIVEVGRSHATARLLSDTRSLVIGIDVATRATGEVTGRLSAPLAMGNVPITEEIAAGDLVVTAGLSLGRAARSFYPRGLLVGRVVDVLVDPGAIVQTALVEPAADLDHLERVLVITDYEPPSIPGPGESPEPEPFDPLEEMDAEEELLEDVDDLDPSPAEPTRRPRARRTEGPTGLDEAP
jgi:rod shape-determining protein MreC